MLRCTIVHDGNDALLAQHNDMLTKLRSATGIVLSIYLTLQGAVSDTAIPLTAGLFTHLSSLDVSGTSGKITDASISLIAQHCSQLTSLDVSDTRKITYASLSLIRGTCRVDR